MAGIRVFGAAALVALASGVPLAEAAKVQEGGNESALPPSRERQIIQLIRTTDNIDGLCNAVEKGHAALAALECLAREASGRIEHAGGTPS